MNISAFAKRIGMDYDLVLEDYCGDVSLISSKLASFVKDCNFATLEAKKAADDEDGLKAEAHRIKKLAEKMGITPLFKAAQLVETAKGNKLENAYEALESEYKKVAEVLAELE